MNHNTRFVIRGWLRKKVLLELRRPNTPTSLARKLDTDRSSVSRSILFLCKKGLLRCLNPKDKRGRMYVITADGKKVAEDIGEME